MWYPCAPDRLLLLLLLMSVKLLLLWASGCQWRVTVNRFATVGLDKDLRDIYMNQVRIEEVAKIFEELVDSAIDLEDKNSNYFGFPYYLKITLDCFQQDSHRAARAAHYSGLRPIVTVTFAEPVHPMFQKEEQLQIEMQAAPYRLPGKCESEEVCQMCWFTPMPLLNGSVVMDVEVKSNGLGLHIKKKRLAVNINGYTKIHSFGIAFTIGTRLRSLQAFMSLSDPSRPLWYTLNRTPVLILGGFPSDQVIIMSDTGFEDFTPLKVAIDSCWIGSIKCPQESFSSSIVDTISMESTLFIRQNQLVYYFTGNYTVLPIRSSASEYWTRILNNVCVKMLNPVDVAKSGSEYMIALGGGWQNGEFFLITIKDGTVKTSASLKSGSKTVCAFLRVNFCSIEYAVFSPVENMFMLLVKGRTKLGKDENYIVSYYREAEEFELSYHIPTFVPKDTETGFVLLLGFEQYTTTILQPKGLSFNPFSMTFYMWGNVLLQSNDRVNYIYLSDFPSTSVIKYFVQSFTGDIAWVTESEQIWVSHEGNTAMKQVYPSQAWTTYTSLQMMKGSQEYGREEQLVSLFYDADGLQELVFMKDAPHTRLTKRKVPLHHLLTYSLMIDTTQGHMAIENQNYIKFQHLCPFGLIRLVNLPFPQQYTRMERYHTKPPDIMDPSGFHSKKSLAVYQGLVYHLLWLHSFYNRPYADPVHDPTWRWWKNKKQDADYYFYVAGNRNSSAGIYVDMAQYVKIYQMTPMNSLPHKIYLDKMNTYTFSVFLSIRTAKESMGETATENSLNNIKLTIILAHPKYISVHLKKQELISRGSVIYEVTVQDNGAYPKQERSGKQLMRSSILLEVVNSAMRCYSYSEDGPVIRGKRMVPVNIGCPPGKRLAFDITATLAYNEKKNKRYFDCIDKDPEMPCFFFSDVFYPFFLIQDMVTGYSGAFKGSYIFKIIGGGPYSESNIRYFSHKEIVNSNTKNGSHLIWVRADNQDDMTNEEGFQILSGAEAGIIWVCQEYSSCYDIQPLHWSAPDYFFVVEVSNRGVDQSTYCDYALEFIVHVHGLHLSPTRAIYLMQMSMLFVVLSVFLYVLICIVGPMVMDFYQRLKRRIEESLVTRADSSYTFSSSYTSQTSLTYLASGTNISHTSQPQSVVRGKP